jgi:hypothetical protein
MKEKIIEKGIKKRGKFLGLKKSIFQIEGEKNGNVTFGDR